MTNADRYVGVSFSEYAIVLWVCSLGAALAVFGLGVPLIEAYYLTKLFVLLPIP